ncbi:MAG: 50S ribosomal protein L7ae [Firmicutes bacterium]|nr:50S ribosomal protein L7ae [Bacillota bacterium]
MRSKLHSYLGFAKKSGNLLMGYNTCIFAMKKNKIKLLIVAEDISENTGKKIEKEAKKHQVACRVHGTSDELSQMAGTGGRSIFGITDQNFAEVILKEIDKDG